MTKTYISLHTLWFGGNYTDKEVTQLYGGKVRIVAKKRFTSEKVYKDVTRKYAERILGDNFMIGNF